MAQSIFSLHKTSSACYCMCLLINELASTDYFLTFFFRNQSSFVPKSTDKAGSQFKYFY